MQKKVQKSDVYILIPTAGVVMVVVEDVVAVAFDVVVVVVVAAVVVDVVVVVVVTGHSLASMHSSLKSTLPPEQKHPSALTSSLHSASASQVATAVH